MTPDPALDRMLARWSRGGAVVGIVAVLAVLAGAAARPDYFFRAYLVGFCLCLGVALGSLALLMLYHLVGGMWGHAARRILEAACRTLPLLLILFVPIGIGMQHVYVWSTRAGAPAYNAPYLNAPFFLVRAAVYFAVWLLLVELLCGWSRREDETGDPRIALRLQRLSGPGLVLWAVTMTFAAWDWMMSIDPHWESTIYGMTQLAGQGLSALAFVIVMLWLLGEEAPLAPVVRPSVFHDLGNLLLALVMIVAYLGFCQYLIIWAGNLTEEIVWFMPRVRTSWAWLAWALVLFYFFLPFVLLLSRRMKRRAATLCGIAAGLLAMRWVELIWLVEPSFEKAGLALHAMDLAVPLALAALWLAYFVSRLRRLPLLAMHDTRVREPLHG